jgi:hypothetical protein
MDDLFYQKPDSWTDQEWKAFATAVQDFVQIYITELELPLY